MLVNQLDCEYEAQAVFLSYKNALKALHDTAPNANSFANNKFAIRFDPLPTEARAQKLDLGIQKRGILSAVANDLYHSRRLEDLRPLLGIDVHKQVGWKQRQDDLHPLPVLPDPDGFIGRKK